MTANECRGVPPSLGSHTFGWFALCVRPSLTRPLCLVCSQDLDLVCSGEHRCCLDILLCLSPFICCSLYAHVTLLLGLVIFSADTTVQVCIPGCGNTHFTLRPTFGATVKDLQHADVSCALVRTQADQSSKFGSTVFCYEVILKPLTGISTGLGVCLGSMYNFT